MKLAYRLELYRSARLDVPVGAVRRAEDLGYHSVWTAEAYGTDALSPLAYLAAFTTRIKLGTAVVQLAARPPATLAMHAMTIDAPGRRWPRHHRHRGVGPADRRGLVRPAVGAARTPACGTTSTIVRKVLDREEPVTHDGPEISLPYRGPGALGQGKALKSIMHPARADPDLAGVGRPAEHRAVRRAVRRLVADGLRPGRDGRATANRWPGASPTAGRRRGRLRDLHRLQRDDHRRRAGRRSTPCGRSPRCTSAAWAARPTTTTAKPWPGAASPRRRPGSRSCGWRPQGRGHGGRARRVPRADGAGRIGCAASASAGRQDFAPPGVTGVTDRRAPTSSKRSSCSPTSPGPETGWRDEP